MKPINVKKFNDLIIFYGYDKNVIEQKEWVIDVCKRIDDIITRNIAMNNVKDDSFDTKVTNIHNMNMNFLTMELTGDIMYAKHSLFSDGELKQICGMFNFGEIDNFYSDPASIKYHANWIGGLFCHSLLVYKAALLEAPKYGIKPEKVSLIACIMHDFCKIGKYKMEVDENDNLVISYNDKDSRYYNSIQHGPESVRRILDCWHRANIINYKFDEKAKLDTNNINRYIDNSFSEGDLRNSLYSVEWEQAVAYHMGVFDVGNSEMKEFSNAAEKNPYVLLLHNADMIATKIYGI